MMRMTTLALVCAAITGCSSGGEGNGHDIPDAAMTPPPPICGDGVCSPSELNSCVPDCGGGGSPMCGNGTCEAGESSTSCPNDCGGGGGGSPMCGNGTCEAGETSASCPNDCGSGGGGGSATCPSDPTSCAACASFGLFCPSGMDMTSCFNCLFGGLGSGSCNNDGICDDAELLDFTCADCL